MALQIRQIKSDKSLGLFWNGNTFASVGSAKTFTSFRSAAVESARISVSFGVQTEVVDSVSNQNDADLQSVTYKTTQEVGKKTSSVKVELLSQDEPYTKS
jgi:hypothetical protein